MGKEEGEGKGRVLTHFKRVNMERKIVVLDGATLGNVDYSRLEKFGKVEVYRRTEPKETGTRIAGAEIVITNKVVIDRSLMERNSTLKLIQITATGMNNVDLEGARQLGIKVKNVAGYSTDSVAQYTLGVVLTLANRILYFNRYGKGQWSNSPIFTHIVEWDEIAGKRWGIIGMGKIGQRVAQLAVGLGTEVVYYSTSGKNLDAGYLHLPLEELLSTSHIITIHAPLNRKTYHLLNRSRLELLQEDTILVNSGRGGIVDEEKVAELLKSGKKFWFATDVLPIEPPPSTNPLLNLPKSLQDRIILTPHIGWTSKTARQKLWEGVIASISQFIEKGE